MEIKTRRLNTKEKANAKIAVVFRLNSNRNRKAKGRANKRNKLCQRSADHKRRMPIRKLKILTVVNHLRFGCHSVRVTSNKKNGRNKPRYTGKYRGWIK